MYSGIGSACGNERNRRIGDPAKRLFERLLNGTLTRLSLPAVKTTAVVFDAKRDVLNDGSQTGAQRPTPLLQFGEQFLRGRLLLVAAFLQHFAEDLPRAILVAHIDVRPSEIELVK